MHSTKPATGRGAIDVARFHWYAGARVALRANGIVGASVIFLFALDIDAVAHLKAMLITLVARTPGWEARGILAGISVVLAAGAAPRVTLGAAGWMRSLPVSGITSRRAATIVLCATQAFVITVATAAVVVVPTLLGRPLDPAKLLGLPLIVIAASALALPVESRAGRALAALALALAVPGGWITDAASIAALVVADRVSGRIVPVARKSWRRSRALVSASPLVLWARLTTRAIPIASLVGALVLPAMFVAFGFLIVRHNPDLDRATATRTIRICGGLALAACAATLASLIVRGRPGWGWGRSLPWSARQRVHADALLHAVPLAALALASAPLDWLSAVIVLSLAPALAAAAAGSIRSGARRQMSAGGEIVAFAVLFGTLIALLPWTAVLVAASTPLLLRWAEQRDRRMLVTKWEELHHDSAGDASWMVAS